MPKKLKKSTQHHSEIGYFFKIYYFYGITGTSPGSTLAIRHILVVELSFFSTVFAPTIVVIPIVKTNPITKADDSFLTLFLITSPPISLYHI